MTVDAKSTALTGHVEEHHHDEGAALISMIQRAAADPNVDIGKMERLFEMHQRMEDRRAVAAYNAAMAKAQAAMPAVVRNQKNEHTKSEYADLYAIADKAMPIIYQNGFGLSFSECPATQPGCLGISCRVSHAAGHAETYQFNVPLDKTGSQGKSNKTDVQAYGSSMTYGRRYATCGVFNIAIRDNDGNDVEPTISDDQAEHLKTLLVDDPDGIPAFCLFYKIDKVGDLPASKYSKALTVIDRRRDAAKRKKEEAAK